MRGESIRGRWNVLCHVCYEWLFIYLQTIRRNDALARTEVMGGKKVQKKRKMKFVLIAFLLAMIAFASTSGEGLPNCLCTREFAPVCANDGVTYGNKCEFNCAKSRLQGRSADDFKIARGGDCNGPEIPQFLEEF
ncbi:turripeptide Ici9.2-like [Neodiprion fabricii]|uniref:turripeptide Ici9.2-like n=1 Tax=Neodiprion fabricii TaxID=2872261 RepID=UPI001ED8F158|nr:turripeptide Ici9.2-like [Neodiprion fabricii]